MILKKIRFVTEDGLKMFGLLHLPEEPTSKVVVFIHGMHSNCTKERDDIIADKLVQQNIAYFTFNNRGSECIIKLSDRLYGSVYEKFIDCVYDINGAILAMQNENFKEIHLLGHSLGSSKILYWYDKDKKYDVKTIGILSLTDLAHTTLSYIGPDKYARAMEFAKNRVDMKRGYEFMPRESFPLPISAKSYLTLFEKNGEIDFIRYWDKNWDAQLLKQIKEPIFMRYGNIKETLVQESDEVVNIVKNKLRKDKLDIGVIDGADHSYHGKEEILAQEYVKFIMRY